LTRKSVFMERNIKKGRVGAPSKYEASFKRKVVQELYAGLLTRGELRKKYHIPGKSAIDSWILWYEEEQKQLVSSAPMISDNKSEMAAIDQPQSGGKIGVEEELRLAKLKIVCLETMIDVAEQTLQIEIRKKAGTKPSGE